MAPERQLSARGGGKNDAERNRDQRIAAEPLLVRRAVEGDQLGVDRGLVERIAPDQRGRDFSCDPGKRVLHVETAEARAAIALVDRLAGAARGAGRRNARPIAPSLSANSASMVGRPRKSQMRRAASDWMTGSLIAILPSS